MTTQIDQTPTTLEPDRYLELMRADARRIGWLAEDGLDAPVPPCPGWTVRDVVVHVGDVYRQKVANMRTLAPAEESAEERPGTDVLAWFRESLALLLAELERRGPGAASYTWWPPDQTVGFWYRRMALESAVHRVDVESASDALGPVDDALALDGIDEILTRFLGREESTGTDAGIIAVRTGDHAWRVALDADGVDVRTGPGSADATVTGEPSELFLGLWGRRPDQAVQITGEYAPVAALREALRAATQ